MKYLKLRKTTQFCFLNDRRYPCLIEGSDFMFHQNFVRNAFLKSREIDLSDDTKHAFGKQNTSYPPVSSWTKCPTPLCHFSLW